MKKRTIGDLKSRERNRGWEKQKNNKRWEWSNSRKKDRSSPDRSSPNSKEFVRDWKNRSRFGRDCSRNWEIAKEQTKKIVKGGLKKKRDTGNSPILDRRAEVRPSTVTHSRQTNWTETTRKVSSGDTRQSMKSIRQESPEPLWRTIDQQTSSNKTKLSTTGQSTTILWEDIAVAREAKQSLRQGYKVRLGSQTNTFQEKPTQEDRIQRPTRNLVVTSAILH